MYYSLNNYGYGNTVHDAGADVNKGCNEMQTVKLPKSIKVNVNNLLNPKCFKSCGIDPKKKKINCIRTKAC